MTRFKLLNEVGQFYSGRLDIEKAIKLYEIEYGFKPEIEDDNSVICVNVGVFKKYNLPDLTEEMKFMKMMQDTGTYNMITEIRPAIIQHLNKSRDEAVVIHNCYMNHYTELFYPENLL